MLSLATFTATQAASFKASHIKKADFFDFERASDYWSNMPNRSDLDEAAAKCDASAYADWVEIFKKDGEFALKQIESLEDSIVIKSCYDLQLTYNVFAEMYATWRQSRYIRPQPFNENTRMMTCTTMSLINPFSDSCNDMPDWRKPEWRAEDEQVLERYREREAKRAARKAAQGQ